MRKYIYNLLLVIGLLFSSSCTTVYYVGESTMPLNIFASNDNSAQLLYTVPANTKVLVKKKAKIYPLVVYQNFEGYLYMPVYSYFRKFDSSTDGNLYGYSTNKPSKISYSSTNSTYTPRRSTSNTSKSSGGSVSVKGYYRKDGTYVRPHTRSAPTRRK